MAMNSAHSNRQQMECLAQMAQHVSLGRTISSAKDLVMSSQPKCALIWIPWRKTSNFMVVVLTISFHFCQISVQLCKGLNGASVTLGEDQFQHATFHDFKIPSAMMPFVRTAMMISETENLSLSSLCHQLRGDIGIQLSHNSSFHNSSGFTITHQILKIVTADKCCPAPQKHKHKHTHTQTPLSILTSSCFHMIVLIFQPAFILKRLCPLSHCMCM